jgi:hopanoid biosynthesis associated RND transporter like protein HpnN
LQQVNPIGSLVKNGPLGKLSRFVSASPGLLIGCGLVLAVLSALYAFLFLRLNSDQNRLVSPKLPYFKTYLEHVQNFGDQEYLFVVIRSRNTPEGKERAIAFAERMAQRLRKHPDLIQAIYYRISAADFGDQALMFASPEEAQVLTDTFVSLSPHLNAWLADGSLAGLIDQGARLLAKPQGGLAELDPAMGRQALDLLGAFVRNIDRTVAGEKSLPTVFDLKETRTEYFFTTNGRLLIMRLLPDKDYSTLDVIGQPLRVVREALEATRSEYLDVEAGLTGRPVLQADEMLTTDEDMTRAAVIAVILVGLLFMLVLHGWLRPLLVLISLVMAIAWTFGFATLTVGELNLLSMVFTLVLVGIGVDFGVHIVMRYVEASKKGLGVEEAIRAALLKTGPSVILGAATSVSAFFSVLGSDILGVAELGLIGGAGILLCLLAMLTVLPALLLTAGKRNLFPSSQPRIVAMPILERLSARPHRLLVLLAVVSLVGLPGLFKIRFNYNLLELQARGLESVSYERLLLEASDESTWYAILTAKTLEETEQLIHRLESIPSVGTVNSILDIIPKGQAEKAALYQEAAKALDAVSPSVVEPGNPDPDALIQALGNLEGSLEELEEKLFAAGAGAELASLDESLEHIHHAREQLTQDPQRALRLALLQRRMRKDIVKSVEKARRWLDAKSVQPGDLPPSLRDIYVGKNGHNQIKVAPREDVWDFEKLAQFVSDLRAVDPDVSGAPVSVLESARLTHRTFLTAALLTVGLVSLILWLYSRSLSYVLLTLLPLGVGILWLLELMGWVGLDFNLANFFGVPVLIAIGVHGGVHFLARWKESNGRGDLFATSTPTAVALSFATTMIGFGGLLFAHHQGLASLGTVMVLGSFTSVLACLLVLPAALKLVNHSSSGVNRS